MEKGSPSRFAIRNGYTVVGLINKYLPTAIVVVILLFGWTGYAVEENRKKQQLYSQISILSEQVTEYHAHMAGHERVELWSTRYRVGYRMASNILSAAREQQIPPRLAFGLVRTESGFRRDAVSYKGAIGLTQVMPYTAEGLQPGITEAELFDPLTNLRLGFTYLRMMLDRFDGDTAKALSAYYGGPGLVSRGWRDPSYENKVLR